MSYKKLGEYIQQVNNRNRDLEVETLLGVSITKKLIPSIANTVGTDMSAYKIIERGQFAYGTITSRNGDKISIALLDEFEKALVSQIYIVFEIIDISVLLPEYLMMWFSRPEFDRYARFHSHGSTRESFDWSDLSDVELPIPSIESQSEIVAQYEAIANKIKVNEAICEKLEAAAEAMYKQWFVDFEFPNEKGLPYQSSGGIMIYNKELEREIPEGWEVKSLYGLADFINGASFKDEDFNDQGFGLPIIKITELKKGITEATSYTLFTKDSKYLIDNDDILYSWSGTPETSLELFKWIKGKAWLNQHIFKIDVNEKYKYFLFNTLKFIKPILIELAKGKQTTGLGHITVKDLKEILLPIPNCNLLESKFFIGIYDKNTILLHQNQKLTQLQSLLLSRLARLDGE